MKVCVFCSSASGLAEPYVRAAESVGRVLGERGHELVFGGFETGLMGVVARGAHAAGARVTGVLPCRAGGLPGRPVFACDELVEASDLNDRKVQMERLSNAFIALPGAYGTLDEFYTVVSGKKLMGANKPVVLLDVDGFFAPLVELDRRMFADGFMGQACADLYATFDQVGAAMDYLESRVD